MWGWVGGGEEKGGDSTFNLVLSTPSLYLGREDQPNKACSCFRRVKSRTWEKELAKLVAKPG